MTLSLTRLVQFLKSQQYIIHHIFAIENYKIPKYLFISHSKNGDVFILTIPDTYAFEEDPSISIGILTDITQAYNHTELTVSTKKIASSMYTPIQTSLFSNALQTPYKSTVSNDTDQALIIDISKQLERLGLCIHNTSYECAMTEKHYFGIFNNGKITMYKSNHFFSQKRKLLVTISIKIFYDMIDTVVDEIQRIHREILLILVENQDIHKENHKKLLNQCAEVIQTPKKYEELLKYIDDFTQLYNDLTVKEQQKIVELEDYKITQQNSIFHELRREHKVSVLEKDLVKIQQKRGKVLKTLIDVRMKCDHCLLQLDHYLFHNTVILEQYTYNCERINELG